MKKYSQEFKVGAFVILCILGLLYMTASTGKLNIKKDGYNIDVVFDEVSGLQTKAPVTLNGLEVGKVDDIRVFYDNDKTKIVLKLWLDKKARIRENSVISIKTLGLMGEKFIQITSSDGKNFIEPGAVLTGKPFMDLDALMEQAQTLSKDIGSQINKLLESLNSTVDGNKGNVSAIVQSLEVTSKNFEEFSDDLKRHPWKLLYRSKEEPKKK